MKEEPQNEMIDKVEEIVPVKVEAPSEIDTDEKFTQKLSQLSQDLVDYHPPVLKIEDLSIIEQPQNLNHLEMCLTREEMALIQGLENLYLSTPISISEEDMQAFTVAAMTGARFTEKIIKPTFNRTMQQIIKVFSQVERFKR